MSDRAVSEVIAFILVFSIVITSIGLLYTVGFGSLNQIQETEQDRSAERAFGAVAVAFEDIQTDRASNRGASIELAGRSLNVNDSEGMTVEVGGDEVNVSGALVYGAFEDTEIVYQAGAVLRVQGEDAQVVSREPRFRCTSDRAVISTMEVQSRGNISFSSDGQVEIVAEQQNPDAARLVASDPSANSVTVSYTGSKYEAAWDQYFSDDDNEWSSTGNPGEGECTGIEGVYVRKTVIDLQFYF